MPVYSKFARTARTDQPSSVRGGESSAHSATLPCWWRLVACLTTARSCRGDLIPLKTFPWHDLPKELGEIILAKVPLLRLAQLASLCKDFQAAYRNRKAAQLALPDWLGHVTAGCELNSFYAAVTQDLDCWRQPLNLRTKHERGPLCLVGPCEGISLSPTWTLDNMRLWYDALVWTGRNIPARVTIQLKCLLEDVKAGKSFSVCASMECQLEGAAPWPPESMVCKSLTLICLSQWPYLDEASATPSLLIFLMLCTALAAPLRRVMHEVAVKLCRGWWRPLRAVPIKSFTLVLPEGRPMPDEAEEAAMSDAITSILAIVGGKPSGARVATKEGFYWHVVSDWRLPCVPKRR